MVIEEKINRTADRANSEKQTVFPVKCAWLEVVLESEFISSGEVYAQNGQHYPRNLKIVENPGGSPEGVLGQRDRRHYKRR